MANLLESMLSGGKVKRQDNKHLDIAKRPLPVRLRQLFELIGALGMNATFPGLLRSLELKHADPQHVFFTALGRWPSLQEVDALPEPYHVGEHLIELIRSMEFRANLVRRACESFPERKRLLFVRIARSGGQSVLTMLDNRHPLLPLDLTAQRFNNPVLLMKTLGHVFMRTASSNSLALSYTKMSAFLDPPAASAAQDDPFAWSNSMPPARVEDTFFTVLRDPRARAMGQLNAQLNAWQAGQAPLPAAIAARMEGGAKAARLADWRQLGRDILAETVLNNPICHALGDGTAEGTLAALRRSPLRLVALDKLNAWSRTELENMASDSEAAGEPILRAQDLRPAAIDALAAATRHDQVLYDRFIKRLGQTDLPVAAAREI